MSDAVLKLVRHIALEGTKILCTITRQKQQFIGHVESSGCLSYLRSCVKKPAYVQLGGDMRRNIRAYEGELPNLIGGQRKWCFQPRTDSHVAKYNG